MNPAFGRVKTHPGKRWLCFLKENVILLIEAKEAGMASELNERLGQLEKKLHQLRRYL